MLRTTGYEEVVNMGSYEREMALVEAGKAQRGKTALDYFAELDAKLDEEASHLSHRPDYGNPRIVDIDGAGVYNMLVKLRTQPEIAKKVLDFKPTCYQGGCGKGDAAFERGYYD